MWLSTTELLLTGCTLKVHTATTPDRIELVEQKSRHETITTDNNRGGNNCTAAISRVNQSHNNYIIE